MIVRSLSLKSLGFFLMMELLMWPGHAALAADPSSIEAFVGSWKGQEPRSPTAALPPDALNLEVQKHADGFRMSWPDLSAENQGSVGVDNIDASFSATDRAGVYEYAPKSGSMLTRMFASPKTGNPLTGETLLWARVDGLNLTVYSMKIDLNGGFDLDHYSWTRTEDGLQLTFKKRTEVAGSEIELQGELEADGK